MKTRSGPARAVDAVRAALPELHRYPGSPGRPLRAALRLTWMRREQFLLGDGSHELLMQLAQAFAGPGDGVLASEFGFGVRDRARAAGAPPRRSGLVDGA